MEKWLSFIVPVYNAETYLAECVESMLHQNMPQEQYEIILFDDGSTDNSLEIARNYAKQYSCIRVFTHANAGVAMTRNAALAQSQGKYIWFVDSDDKIAENILPTMRQQIETENLDILFFNITRFNNKTQWIYIQLPETTVRTGIQLYNEYHCNVDSVNKIYRKSLFIDNHLQFRFRMAEDAELMPRCYYHANRVKMININGYYYRVNENSLTHICNQERWTEYNLLCIESHIDYMFHYPAPRYWIRVLAYDTRLIFYLMPTFSIEKNFKDAVFNRLRTNLRKAFKSFPVILSTDYIFLRIATISPTLAIKILQILRNLKKLVKK